MNRCAWCSTTNCISPLFAGAVARARTCGLAGGPLSFDMCCRQLAALALPVNYSHTNYCMNNTLQVPWREYVSLAWQVDPCLALSLLDHFPASEPLRAALEAMVVKHAADTQVRHVLCALCAWDRRAVRGAAECSRCGCLSTLDDVLPHSTVGLHSHSTIRQQNCKALLVTEAAVAFAARQ